MPSKILHRLMGRAIGSARLTLLLPVLAILAGCTAGQVDASLGELPDAAAAGANVFGTGPQVVGVLAFHEPDNLSDGDAESVFRAARLAAETIKGNPLTVVVRTVGADAAHLGAALTDFESLGVRMVIGTNDARDAADAAKFMIQKRVPTISLTSFADLALQLYAAALVPNEEAVAIVNEAGRRGYRSIAVVGLSGGTSQSFTKAVLSLAAAAGIDARPIDGSTDSQAVAGLTAMASAGVAVDAVVFAVGPERAGSVMASLRTQGSFKSVPAVGTSGWALADMLAASLKGGWYTVPEGQTLSAFAEKFRAANGVAGTLNAALVYDLLVLAGALPQAIPDEPYHPEVLTNQQGFSGFTGFFKFGPTGMAGARNYVIATAR